MKLTGSFEAVLRIACVAYTREYKFHPTRRWRADFAIIPKRILIEYEGGVYAKGRHVRGKGYANDCEKYNEAQRLGWKVYRFTSDDLLSCNLSRTIDFIKEVCK